MARILLVENDAGVSRAHLRILRQVGHDVVAVEDGAAALRQLERDTRFHLAIVDLNLGHGMSGLQLAHHIETGWPETGILITTGSPDVASERLGYPLLTKPHGMDELIAVVESVLATRTINGTTERMSPDERETLPPQAVAITTEPPDPRMSDPDLVRNAPKEQSIILQRFDGVKEDVRELREALLGAIKLGNEENARTLGQVRTQVIEMRGELDIVGRKVNLQETWLTRIRELVEGVRLDNHNQDEQLRRLSELWDKRGEKLHQAANDIIALRDELGQLRDRIDGVEKRLAALDPNAR